MAQRLLFVCRANVCRSPFMQSLFLDHLRVDGAARGWTIASAGTDVTHGMRMCEVASARVLERDPAASLPSKHRSTLITARRLFDQDMIVVATLEERAKVALLQPEVRSRTFTLREAVFLGSMSADLAAREQVRKTSHLRAYADLLHSRRGLAVANAPRLITKFSNRAPAQKFDTPDAHHLKSRRHVAALRDIDYDISLFYDQLVVGLHEVGA